MYLENYGIIPESEKQLYEHKTSSVTDPAKRRELKIKQYQKEKELRLSIEVWILMATGKSLRTYLTLFSIDNT